MRSPVFPLALGLLLTSAQAATFTHKALKFSVDAPAAWTVSKNPGATIMYIPPKTTKGAAIPANVNVVVEKFPQPQSQKRYHDRTLAQIKAIPDTKVLSDRATTLGGSPAHELIYTTKQGPANVYVNMTYAVKGRNVYTVSGAAPRQEEVLPVIQTFVKSFKFLP